MWAVENSQEGLQVGSMMAMTAGAETAAPSTAAPLAATLLEGQEPDVSVNFAVKRAREDEVTALGDKRWPGWPGDNVFRLLVPVQKVGSIIGRRGEFVKKMCEETRSRIKILDGIAGTSERVVMVSAREEPEAVVSPAMDAFLKVHWRIIEGTEGEGDSAFAMQIPAGGISSRILVAATQAGSLIGRQGTTIKSIQDTSGAVVRVLSSEDLPLCALQDDRVVEIQGEASKVHRAMELVVWHLRKFLVDRSVLPLFELNRAVLGQQSVSYASWGPSAAGVLPSTAGGWAAQYASANLQQDSYYQTSDLLDSQTHHHGVSMYGKDPGTGAFSGSVAVVPTAPVITQVNQHMQIPLSYADAIIGSAGANISYMRRASGAAITIQETRGVPGEMTVEIQGSTAQVQTAQQLIQNFMAGALTVPSSTYSTVDTTNSSYPQQTSLYPASSVTTDPSAGAYVSSYSNSYAY